MYKLDFYFVLQSIHTKISMRNYGAFIKKKRKIKEKTNTKTKCSPMHAQGANK